MNNCSRCISYNKLIDIIVNISNNGDKRGCGFTMNVEYCSESKRPIISDVKLFMITKH